MTTSGIAEFGVSMAEIAEIPDSVLDGMLTAQADVIEPAQRAKGRSYGVHLTGVTLASIKRSAVKRGKDGKYIIIMPQGTNADGNRNAEVAFVNEYGKRGQAPRPFIRDANETSSDQAAEAAAKKYDQWLNSKNL